MSGTPPHPAKPGTACLGCRSRKLKCSREQEGCSNCLKGELPCVYPAPETGVKRKRGPYRKDKAARERHLDDLVKYLEPHADGASSQRRGGGNQDGSTTTTSPSGGETSNSVKSRMDAGRQTSNSEDLVKDALIALTTSHPLENELEDNGLSFLQRKPQAADQPGGIAVHPPARRIFEYWHIYVTRIDPMLKIIHCPTFGKTLFTATEDLPASGPVTETLLFAIYHAAISTCSAREVRKRFGEERSVLLQRYGRVVESTLADNYSMPVLESLQALVLYIISMRRDDSLTNVRALFSLAVRMAQLIGLNKDPGNAFTPYETEMRRRLWWHICGLESRGAEEGGARQSSIMDNCYVQLPTSLNDFDLDPEINDRPEPRRGVTDMTWILLRWEIVRLTQEITKAKRASRAAGPDGSPEALKIEQKKTLESYRRNFEEEFLRHLHPSRPYDWLCIAWIEGMMTKCRLMVEFKTGQMPTKDMPAKDRFTMLQGSVDIIRLTGAVANYKAIQQWAWYFRGWVQWHAIAIVIAELGHNKNQQFVSNAWAVLDPVLADWDKVYEAKRDEPAWEHVNTMISRARKRRQQVPIPPQNSMPAQQVTTDYPAPGLAAPPTAPFSAIWQTDWNGPDATGSTIPLISSVPNGQPQFDISMVTNTPYANGAAPVMPDQDWDFGYMANMDDIDFSAFEGVFGDTAWYESSPSTDFNLSGTNLQM